MRALPTSVSATIDGVPDYLRTYEYDTSGNVTRITQTSGAPSGSGGSAVAEIEIDLAYDDAGRLVSVARYLDDQLVVTSTYVYDALGDLVSLTHAQGETVLADYAWTYDLSGLLDASGSPSSAYGELCASSLLTSMTSVDGTATYTYDPTGQLLGATYSPLPQAGEGSGGEGSLPDETYSYDLNGNRTNAGYVIGTDNQLLSDGAYWYSYDAEGNRTARYVWTDADADGLVDLGERSQITEYAWDQRNRLVSVTDYATDGGPATQQVEYVYDVHNRWIARIVDADGDGAGVSETTNFVYDVTAASPTITSSDGQTTQAAQIVFQFNDSGSLTNRYLCAQAVDQLLADEQLLPLPPAGEGGGEGISITDLTRAGNVLWPLTDHLGTVRDLTTGVTAVVNHRVYDSFGNLKSQTNAAVDSLFGFTGRPFDAATGLQNNLNRWYDSRTGKWPSEDSTGCVAGDTNLCRYVTNSPTQTSDPTGCNEHHFYNVDGYPVDLYTVEGTDGFFKSVVRKVFSPRLPGRWGQDAGDTDGRVDKPFDRLDAKLTITVTLNGPDTCNSLDPMDKEANVGSMRGYVWVTPGTYQVQYVWNIWGKTNAPFSATAVGTNFGPGVDQSKGSQFKLGGGVGAVAVGDVLTVTIQTDEAGWVMFAAYNLSVVNHRAASAATATTVTGLIKVLKILQTR